MQLFAESLLKIGFLQKFNIIKCIPVLNQKVLINFVKVCKEEEKMLKLVSKSNKTNLETFKPIE